MMTNGRASSFSPTATMDPSARPQQESAAAASAGRMRERMIRSYREPTLDDILSASIVKAMMEADGVDACELRAMLRRIAVTLRTARSQAEAAPIV